MNKLTFIAEIGVNHHGNMEKALRMIEKAAECGATYAKFQFYDPVKVLGRSHPDLAYAQFCYLSKAQHETLRKHCELIGIEYLVSVFDVKDVSWAASLSKAMKIATRMNRRQDFISLVEKTKKETFMSVQPDLGVRIPKRFKLMWCIPEYPSKKEDIIKYPYSGFGLSSHCPDPSATIEAIKLGARVIENHICESRDEMGCDIPASLIFEEYKKVISEALASI